MNKLYSRIALILALVVMFAIAPAALADTIAPGQSTTNLTPSNPSDTPIGLPIASIVGSFAGKLTGLPSGSYTAQVFNNTNGFLDFVYQFSNTGARDFVDSVTMANFAGFTTDVFVEGSGNSPVSAESTGVNPNVIKFFFSNGTTDNDVNPGQSSNLLVIATNAKAFTNGVFTLQDGDTAAVPAFQPVPEPSSMLLLGTGLSFCTGGLGRLISKQHRFRGGHL